MLLTIKIVAKMMKKLLQKSLIKKNIFLPAFEVILPFQRVIVRIKITILIMKMILLKLSLIKRRTRQALQILSFQEIINNVEGIKNNINQLRIK